MYPEWPSEARMSILLTKFPEQKTALLNTTSYNDKLQFWKSRLNASLADNKCIFFNLATLTSDPKFNMIYKGKAKPDQQIFQIVIANNLNTDYVDATNHDRNTEAILSSVENTWGFWMKSKVTNAVFGGSTTDYVSNTELSRLADLLKDHLESASIRIFDKEGLNAEITIAYGRILTEREFTALLAFLKGKGVVSMNSGRTVFRVFGESGGALTQGEEAKFQLEKSVNRLGERIGTQEARVLDMKREIKEVMNKGQKTKALNILKRVKGIEKKLDNLYNQQGNIQTILDTLLESESEAEILKTLATGVKSLKSINSHTSISQVDDVMSDLSEALADANDVSHALGTSFEPVDQSDLDLELDQLAQEIEAEEKKTLEIERKSREDATLERLKEIENDTPNQQDDIFGTLDEICGRITQMEVNPTVRFENSGGDAAVSEQFSGEKVAIPEK